jgi:hypothetical protein
LEDSPQESKLLNILLIESFFKLNDDLKSEPCSRFLLDELMIALIRTIAISGLPYRLRLSKHRLTLLLLMLLRPQPTIYWRTKENNNLRSQIFISPHKIFWLEKDLEMRYRKLELKIKMEATAHKRKRNRRATMKEWNIFD